MNTESLLERFDKFINSEEGQRSLKEFAEELNRKHERVVKAKTYLDSLSQEEFEQKLLSEIEKHDDNWRRKCYDKGYEPYPSNLLGMVFSVADLGDESTEYNEILDDFDAHFGAGTKIYRDYYFNWIFGQGTVLRIFNKNKEEIFRT